MGFFREYRQISNLLKKKQQVVFYAEGRNYYQYFEKLITDLLNQHISICYITSDSGDPILKKSQYNFNAVCVKWMLGFLFLRLRSDVMIMTMTDLGTYLFKRSKDVGSYIYIFHAMVSTHQQYSKNAFQNYDAIFCTGMYQEKEIRKAEKVYGHREKELISYGYPLIDSIGEKRKIQIKNLSQKLNVLIAPSWFDGCIFESCINKLLLQLSSLPYTIVVRFHPEYKKRNKRKFNEIKKLIEGYSNITVDTLSNIIDRLPLTDILITDRSGIAFEFAFGMKKPVLFIETGLKINNPEYLDLNIEPIENELRNKVGLTLSISSLDLLENTIKELEKMTGEFNQSITELEKELLYNSESSYKKGVDYIISKLRKN